MAPVIVVGAGPVGLMLATELRLHGVEVVVVERRTEPSGESRGLGFTARATELFDQRGLLARFGEVETGNLGHFGGIPVDFSAFPGSHFGARGIPQYRIETMLEERATELGATVLRGHELVSLTDTGDHVVATAAGPAGPVELTGSFLVGCDGGQSTVRRLGGFTFAGTDATREMYLADVVGRNIRQRFIGERTDEGMVMAVHLGDGVDRIIVCPDGRPSTGRRAATWPEVADWWARLTGERLHDAEVTWVSVFTDATRQATEYRRGRVLLAGDAAHIHLPAGGQGLSLGVVDAVNLGWKLAATVRGCAPAGLLDTYHAEQHPVGARVLRNTLAQGMVYLNGSEVDPLRSVLRELVAIPEVARHLSGMVSGLDIRHDVGGEHPLAGTRMPHVALDHADGSAGTVAELLHAGRGVVLDAGGGDKTAVAADWADRVDLVAATPVVRDDDGGWPSDVDAVLVRPDGYVAWVAPGGEDLADALHRWFGAPA